MRTFSVLVKDPRNQRWISYPGTGQTGYDGPRAVYVMERFEARGFGPSELQASTRANEISELLSLPEMKEIYPRIPLHPTTP